MSGTDTGPIDFGYELTDLLQRLPNEEKAPPNLEIDEIPEHLQVSLPRANELLHCQRAQA